MRHGVFLEIQMFITKMKTLQRSNNQVFRELQPIVINKVCDVFSHTHTHQLMENIAKCNFKWRHREEKIKLTS